MLQSLMVQDGDNVNINFENGQKIIIKNTLKTELSATNLAIGLAADNDGEILFGDDGDNILFGDDGDNIIYGCGGNDELWGGKGKDALYGEAGDDVLQYEADGKFSGEEKLIFSDEKAYYWGYSHRYEHPAHYFSSDLYLHIFTPKISEYVANYNINSDDDIIFSGGVITSKNYLQEYRIDNSVSRAKDIAFPDWQYYGLNYVDQVDYEYKINAQYFSKNFYDNTLTEITGYNRTFDIFDGGEGVDTILMTQGNDVLALDDSLSQKQNQVVRINDISVIYAGDGNDLINFSTKKYSYGNLSVYGGDGDDKILTSQGDDIIFGQNDNDEIFAGDGKDIIDGGNGDDKIYGGSGNDIIDGNQGNDEIYAQEGDDIIYASQGSDLINGGEGFDTLSFENSDAAININLSLQVLSGGFAQGDIIENIENIVASNFNDIIVGSDFDNILSGKSGNETIFGGNGNDTYTYEIGDGEDVIEETGYGFDTIKFGSGISKNSLFFTADDNDLIIKVGANEQDKIIIKNQKSDAKIEYIKFTDEFGINLLTQIYFTSEDSQAIEISKNNLDQILVSSNIKNNIFGGFGDDRIYGENQDDILRGNLGNDQIYGAGGADIIYGGTEISQIIKSSFDWQYYLAANPDLNFSNENDV